MLLSWADATRKIGAWVLLTLRGRLTAGVGAGLEENTARAGQGSLDQTHPESPGIVARGQRVAARRDVELA